MGRLPIWSDDEREAAFAEICIRLAETGALRKICKDPHLPAHVTVYEWMDKYPDYAARYARAREQQADCFAEEIIEIVDTATVADAHVARLKMDARKWLAGKLRPKVYGDRQTLAGDPEHPIAVVGEESVELKRRIAGLAARNATGGSPGKSDG